VVYLLIRKTEENRSLKDIWTAYRKKETGGAAKAPSNNPPFVISKVFGVDDNSLNI